MVQNQYNINIILILQKGAIQKVRPKCNRESRSVEPPFSAAKIVMKILC